jgi:hypothetical protein
MLPGILATDPAFVSAPQIEVVRQLSYRNNDRSLKLCRVRGSLALFFQSKMSCDVDGSPNAYHPDDDGLALDTIASAGGRRKDDQPSGQLIVQPSPEVVVYENGKPYLQPDGPFRGFYVSETSLSSPDLPATSPARYLDARTFPYVVLPGGLVPEADLGDLIAVYDPLSEKLTYALYGDIGPSSECGEASLATFLRLGLPAIDGKSSPCEVRHDMFYLVFPRSAWRIKRTHQWPPPLSLVDSSGNREFRQWGGMRRLKAVLAAPALSYESSSSNATATLPQRP